MKKNKFKYRTEGDLTFEKLFSLEAVNTREV